MAFRNKTTWAVVDKISIKADQESLKGRAAAALRDEGWLLSLVKDEVGWIEGLECQPVWTQCETKKSLPILRKKDAKGKSLVSMCNT